MTGGELDVVNRIHREQRNRNAFCMWWIGMINNFHYCLVLSGSLSLAEGYGMRQYVALIMWANVFFGIVARIINALVLSLLSFNIRVTVTYFMGLLAIFLVSFAYDIGGHNNVAAFVVLLIGVVFIGTASSYGESVFLGYMERLPSKQVGAWSSGTGLSGVAASLIYLGLTHAGFSNSSIFLMSTPFLAMYWAFYFFGLKLPVETREGGYKAMVNWKGTPWRSITPVPHNKMPECLKEMRQEQCLATEGYEDGVYSEQDGDDSHRSQTFNEYTWPILKSMHKFTLWNNFNLASVYIAEYAVQFMAPFCFPCKQLKESKSFWIKNAFVLTQFCYQFGVLISRSSLVCVRIRQVWILTVIQVINAVAWFVEAKVHFLEDPDDEKRQLTFTFILFAWMVFVGLLGGASYVNVFYNILEETKEAQNAEIAEFVAWRGRKRAPGLSSERVFNDTEFGEPLGSEEEEATIIRDCVAHITAEWKTKRDMAMNIGALYVTVGITLGSLLDLFFTVVVLRGGGCS